MTLVVSTQLFILFPQMFHKERKARTCDALVIKLNKSFFSLDQIYTSFIIFRPLTRWPTFFSRRGKKPGKNVLLITVEATLRNRIDILSKFVSDVETDDATHYPRGYEKVNYVHSRGLWGEWDRHPRSEILKWLKRIRKGDLCFHWDWEGKWEESSCVLQGLAWFESSFSVKEGAPGLPYHLAQSLVEGHGEGCGLKAGCN